MAAVRITTPEAETELAVEALDYTRRHLRRGALGAVLGLFGLGAGCWLRWACLPRFGRLATPLVGILNGLAGYLVGSGGVFFVFYSLVFFLALTERRRLRRLK